MRKLLLLVVLLVTGYTGLTQYRQLPSAGGRVTGVKSAVGMFWMAEYEGRTFQ